MKVAILTGLLHSSASNCLPALVEHPGVEVAMIIHAESQFVSRKRKLRRDLRKVRQIGPTGALVGYNLRSWYQGPPQRDVRELASEFGIPFETTPRTNAPETSELLRKSGAELGLSLGNGLITPRTYRTPPRGMINVHGEVLPRFQGASSVIWAIHEGIAETGFTIHEVEKSIDTGRIIYRERFPIEFEDDFRATVQKNVAEITRRIPAALADVVANYDRYWEDGFVQQGGQSFTTPTLRQFLTMRRQFARLRDLNP